MWKIILNFRSVCRSNESMSVREEHVLNQCIGHAERRQLCNSNIEKQAVVCVNSVNDSIVTTLTEVTFCECGQYQTI